jgi:hypothetical protein
VLGPCHGGGELATGQRSGRRGARGKGPAGAGWGGSRRPSDAWSARSWRWRRGRSMLGTWPGKAAASDAKQNRGGNRGAVGVPEEEEEGRGSGGLVCKIQKS